MEGKELERLPPGRQARDNYSLEDKDLRTGWQAMDSQMVEDKELEVQPQG